MSNNHAAQGGQTQRSTHTRRGSPGRTTPKLHQSFAGEKRGVKNRALCSTQPRQNAVQVCSRLPCVAAQGNTSRSTGLPASTPHAQRVGTGAQPPPHVHTAPSACAQLSAGRQSAARRLKMVTMQPRWLQGACHTVGSSTPSVHQEHRRPLGAQRLASSQPQTPQRCSLVRPSTSLLLRSTQHIHARGILPPLHPMSQPDPGPQYLQPNPACCMCPSPTLVTSHHLLCRGPPCSQHPT